MSNDHQLNIIKVIKKVHKKACKGRKKKVNNMAMANTKIYQKMKMKSFLSIERNIIE